jgi:hypothetical protein
MNNQTERKHTAVKVRYTAEDFTRLKKAFARSTCRTIAGYIRKLSLQQPVEILHRNASFDDFVGEIVRLREEMSAVHHIASWTPDQRARLLFLQAEIQSSIDKIAKLCMP